MTVRTHPVTFIGSSEANIPALRTWLIPQLYKQVHIAIGFAAYTPVLMTKKRSSQNSWATAIEEDYVDLDPSFSGKEGDISRLFKMGFVSLEEIDYFDPKKVESTESMTVPKTSQAGTWTVSTTYSKKVKTMSGDNKEDGKKQKHQRKNKQKKQLKEKKPMLPTIPPIAIPGIEDMTAWTEPYDNLDALLVAGLKSANFLKPLVIQQATLNAYMGDKKQIILASAPTGSGKTLAFALPILNQIYLQRRKQMAEAESTPAPLTALIIVPTRELAVQIEQHILAVTKFSPDSKRVRTATIIGGMAAEKQARLLNQRPDIIIATPGRLAELVEFDEGGLKESLKAIQFVVLDEADRLIQPGHFKELDDILARILGNNVSISKSIFLFSATLVQSTDPKAPFNKLLDRLSIPIKSVSKPGSSVAVLDFADRPATLEEFEFSCSSDREEEKVAALMLFLKFLQQQQPENNGHFGRVLLFVNAIDSVRKMTSLLALMLPKEVAPAGLLITGLHAQLQQRQRLKNLERFKAAKSTILVATDVASRGLDIPGVEHVIHYHLPRSTDTYIHRCGRTARAMNAGRSLVLLTATEWRSNAAERIFPTTRTVHEFVPNQAMMRELMLPAVRHAMLIEAAETSTRKQTSQERWAQKAADDLGIILDDDNDPNLKRSEKNAEQQVSKKSLAHAQAELRRLVLLLSKE